jgi:hypothetical protein
MGRSLSRTPFSFVTRYRSTSNVKLPLRIIPSVTEVGTTQVQYTITVKANFNTKLSATDIVLRIPTPLNTTSTDCKTPTGKAKYTPSENVIVWKYEVFFDRFWRLADIFWNIQNSKTARWPRVHYSGNRRSDKNNYATSLGAAPH